MKLKLLIAGLFAIGLVSNAATEEYGGGEMHTVKVGDRLIASNGWGLEVDSITSGEISFVLVSGEDEYYTTTIESGTQKDLTNGIRSTKEVISVTVDNVNEDSAEVEVHAIEDDTEEEEDAPAPPGEEEETSTSETFEGDGTYLLSPGDSIRTDRGYRIQLQEGQSWDKANDPVRVLLYDQNDEKIALHDYRDYTILSKGSSRRQFSSRGLKAVPKEIHTENDTVSMRASSNLDIQVYEGWNLISTPLAADGSNIVDSTCGDVESMSFWDFSDGSYVQSSLNARNGYWLKSDQSCEITVQGSPFEMPEVQLDSGWNIIGAPTSGMSFDSLEYGDCEIESGPWGYRPAGYRSGYYEAANLDRGKGYFVKTAESCTLSASYSRIPGGQ